MGRPKDCIYCGKPTGSREHPFPAALGGRRRNKGILCGGCNGHFSALDQLLANQLQGINGLLGIRPDYADEAVKARVEEPGSNDLIAIDAKGIPEYARAKVTREQATPTGRVVTVRFGNEQQIDKWIRSQRKSGEAVVRLKRHEGKRYYLQPLEAQWTFGGAEAFREVGRIALNFLAHHFPALARREDLRPFKRYVLGEITGDYVGYDFNADFDRAPPERFPFGHRILIGLDADSGDAFARVSFFSTFDFAVRFGRISPPHTVTVITDIDPLAESEPHDLRVIRVAQQAIAPVSRPSSEVNLSNEVNIRLQQLFRKIDERRWNLVASELLPRINGTRTTGPGERRQLLSKILERYTQAMLVVIQETVAGAKAGIGAQPPLAVVAGGLLDSLVQPDEGTDTGLAPKTETLLVRMQVRVVQALSFALNTADVDATRLRSLLQGTEAQAIAAQIIMEEVTALAHQQQ